MKRGILSLLLVGLAAIMVTSLAWVGCGQTTEEPDGGDGGEDGGIDDCVVDDSRPRPNMLPDWELVPDGEPGTGTICPRSDVDHYFFTVASAGTILSVDLSNNVPLSAVDLCYNIFPEDDSDPMVGGKCDHDGLDGVTEVVGSHYLPAAGTYFLEVRDEASDDQDARNPYVIQLSQMVDPDGNEPNNHMGQSTSLSASAQGYISFLGDQDWFSISVGSAGQILSVDLTTTATTPVDLRYTIYRPDGTSAINTGANSNGQSGPTALSDVLALGEAGTYFLVITDDFDDDADLEIGYSVQVSLQQNPDSRDRGATNDAPEDATIITSGSTVSDGYLATRADQDFYRIEAAGVSDSNPALIEIDLVISDSSPVDPAIDLIVGDPNTPCSQGDACDVLTWSCGTGSCSSAECRNAQCPSHECLDHENRCRGAGFCLPEGGCGIRSLVMHGADWSTTGSMRHLHTVAPMYGSVYYVLVRDFMGDDLDVNNAYQLTVTVRNEPDSNEQPPNGLYLPYATDEQEEETRRWNYGLAKSVSCSEAAGFDGIECQPFTGYLSFRGDQDWFVLQGIPNEAEATPVDQSTDVDWDMQYEWSYNGTAGLFINYTQFGEEMGWNHQGAGSGIFGDDECAYMCGEYHRSRPLYMRVQHSDRKKWDYQSPYTVTVRAYRRCPLTCSWCDPATTDYACPTADNPCPQGGC